MELKISIANILFIVIVSYIGTKAITELAKYVSALSFLKIS